MRANKRPASATGNGKDGSGDAAGAAGATGATATGDVPRGFRACQRRGRSCFGGA
ncbi:MAG: hypothetical protein LBR07_02115 [Puniceicoccales bacterium]|nr:hypothetical protein [Puniceicoccales bacterium]